MKNWRLANNLSLVTQDLTDSGESDCSQKLESESSEDESEVA